MSPKLLKTERDAVEAENAKLRINSTQVRNSVMQLGVLLDSGVNIIDSLDALKRGAGDTLALVLNRIARELEQGQSLSRALVRFPKVFPRMLIELAKVGEETGALASSLLKANSWLAKQDALKKKLINALSYPVSVAVVAFLVNVIVLKFSMPQMTAMLESLGQKPPMLTEIVFGLGTAISSTGFLVTLALGVSVLWFLRERFFTEKVVLRLSYIAMELPIVGPLWKAVTLARFCSTLSLSLEVNLNMLRALSLSYKACGNPVYLDGSEQILSEIRQGTTLSSAFGQQPALYPNMLCQFMQAGEESGSIVKSLSNLSGQLEDEVDHRISVLGQAIEPILLGACAVFVGLFVFATLLPLQQFLAKLM